MTINWIHSVAYFLEVHFTEEREEYERVEIRGLMIPFLRDRCINGA
jgi:hypothetical protein